MALTPYSRVEVLGRGLGLENSMYAATLIRIDGQRSWVEYESVWEEEEGHRLIEEIGVRSIRPYPPMVTMSLSAGYTVDAYERGGFWRGVLVGQTETQNQVYFDYTIPALQNGSYDFLDTRVHMEWRRGDVHSAWSFHQETAALRIGGRAELLARGRGLENSMYPVNLISLNGRRCLVGYDSVFGDDGKLLVEEVHVKNVRPCPPMVAMTLSIGDLVDVFDKGAWWRAVIVGKTDTQFHVYFDYMNPELRHGIYDMANIRIHMDWQRGTPLSIWTFYHI